MPIQACYKSARCWFQLNEACDFKWRLPSHSSKRHRQKRCLIPDRIHFPSSFRLQLVFRCIWLCNNTNVITSKNTKGNWFMIQYCGLNPRFWPILFSSIPARCAFLIETWPHTFIYQVMACGGFGSKPLYELAIIYWEFSWYEQISASWNQSKDYKMFGDMSSAKFQPFWCC